MEQEGDHARDDRINDNANVEQELAAQVPEQFAIRDHRAANWVVRRILAARHYARRVKLYADAELKGAHREEAVLPCTILRRLEQWAIREINLNGGRRRYIALPAGRICMRRVPAWVEVADEAALIAWCRAHFLPRHRYVRTTSSWRSSQARRVHRRDPHRCRNPARIPAVTDPGVGERSFGSFGRR